MAGSTVTPTQSDSRVLRSPLFRVRSRWAGGSGEVVFVREVSARKEKGRSLTDSQTAALFVVPRHWLN